MKKKQVVALLASTALAVSVTSGCGCANTSVETEEPVVVEETAPVVEEEPVVEETVEEVEEAIEETVVSENTVTEEEPVVEEEPEEALPWEPVMYDEPLTMYAKKTCNVRSGPSTSYEKVNSLSWAQEVVVIGEVTYENSTWYILEYSNLDTQEYQMVASSLLQDTKPQAQAPAPQQQTQPQQQPSSGGNACSDCGANCSDCGANCSDCPDCPDCSDNPSGGCFTDAPCGSFGNGGGCFDCGANVNTCDTFESH